VELSCQEQLLPGESILQKWEFAASAGFDSMELRGMRNWREQLNDLKVVREQGDVFS
jgi:hypothetical protein